MKGHQALVDMRLGGKVPSVVWIDTEPSALREWADWQSITPDHAHVWVEAADRRLDLRFVVGLTVSVSGLDAERVAHVAHACQEAGAKRVIASVQVPVPEDFKTVSVTDTEGAFHG